jgi:type IV secretory pathway TrbL component
LAWSRTAIAFLAIGAAILKKNVVGGIIVLALAVLIWFLHRIFPDPGAGAAADATRPRQLLLVTVTVTVVALIALGIAVLGR